jgi:peptide/nickel transport system permease protein
MKAPVRIILGTAMIGTVIAAALLSLLWTPYDPTAMNIAERLRPPSSVHLFGSDPYGRDVFSMILAGARGALGVALAAALIGIGLGVPLGLWAAAGRSWVDEIAMRVCDVVFSFPAVVVAVLIAASFGPGARNAVIAIGIFNIPVFARLTRNAARGQWSRDYVWFARSAGRNAMGISLTHILPNILGLLGTQATIQLSIAVLADAGLSYVGLGTQPPMPSWGRMLEESQTMIGFAPWLSLFPGLAVVLTVLGLSLLGDGLGALRRLHRSPGE